MDGGTSSTQSNGPQAFDGFVAVHRAPRRRAQRDERAAMTGKTNGHHVDDAADRAARWERATLGALIEEPQLFKQAAANLTTQDFLLGDHRRIFAALAELNHKGSPVDLISLSDQLGDSVAIGYLSSLLDGVVVPNFTSYVRGVREAARDRQFQRLQGQLTEAHTIEDRARVLDQMQEALREPGADQDWRAVFHSFDEFENAPPLRFAINNFLQEEGITVIGGLAGHGKTLVMLSMAGALLDGTPLFGHRLFDVTSPAERVLYLVPESSIGPFWSRIQLFRMQEHVRAGRLLVRTLSSREEISGLDDARLLKAAQGAHVFLDTAVRFMAGSENDVENTRPFADALFRLLGSGARTITGAHHSPKGFEGQDFMTLENLLRGSGDIGAMLCTAWGVRQVDADKNQLFVQNVKPRDFQPCAPFVLEGRPHLDEAGQFKMLAEPGTAGEMRSYLRAKGADGGRPATSGKGEKLREAVELRSRGVSVREIAKTIEVPKSTVDRWLFDHDASQKVSHGGTVSGQAGTGTGEHP
jgi:hypothetical protein